MEIFKNMAEGLGSYRRSVKHILSEEPVPMLVTGLSHVHKAHFLAAMAQSDDVRASLPILCIVESEAAAVRMCEDINTLCGKRAAYQFPAADMILTDTEAQSAEYSHRRIEALSAAAGGRADIIVASSEASLQLTVPMDVLREHTFVIESGAQLDTAELSKKLISAGYSRCELIEGKGQFSIRGSLVDIYPVNSEQPIRAELWGDEVDTVSTFDIETQRRTDSIDRAEITPCFETVFYSNEELIENAGRALADITKCAIVSTNAVNKFSVITKVDVIPTGKRMYVLLLITSEGNIKNRVCRLSFDLTNEQMQFFTQFVNEHLQGLNLNELSDEFIERISESLGTYMLSLSPLLKAVADLSAELAGERVDMTGEKNLLTCSEFSNAQIVEIIERKDELSRLLDDTLSGIQIKFGKDSDTFAVTNSSIIGSSFSKDGKKAGSFGVIGPMRIDYKKIIPYIEYFSSKVTKALSEEEKIKQIKQNEEEAD